MKTNPILRVGVLFGGKSSEHEISQRSAASVIQCLDRSRFKVVPIGISRTGEWFLHDLEKLSFDDINSVQLDDESTPLSFSLSGNDLHEYIDVVFPMVHGKFCEDGRLQGLLDFLELPYVGSGVSGSAVMMDKVLSNRVAESLDIRVPKWMNFSAVEWQNDAKRLTEEISVSFRYPLFVKPVVTGSSVGVSKVESPDGLQEAIELALGVDVNVMVVAAVKNVRECEIAVLENIHDPATPIVTMAGEIVPHHSFYSYAAKYLDDDGADLVLPANLPVPVLTTMQACAATLFRALNCEGLGRVDFLWDEKADVLYFNELNSLPGFTSISLYPKLCEFAGIEYPDLLTRLIELAIARHKRQMILRRELVIPA